MITNTKDKRACCASDKGELAGFGSGMSEGRN